MAELLTDSISYCMMMNAVVRAGHIPFAISTRNSGSSLAQLFSVIDTAFVYTSTDSSVQNIFASAAEKLLEVNGKNITSFPIPRFDDLQADLNQASLLPPLSPPSMSSTAIILHSSGKNLNNARGACIDRKNLIIGSTSSLLKPIRTHLLYRFDTVLLTHSLGFSHKTYLQWSTLPCYGERDLCGEVMACQSIPILCVLLSAN